MRASPTPDPPTGPVRLGLTGGIGAGKSTALAAFARRGAAVLSSDDIVHALYREPDVAAAVRARFGDAVMSADGQVDRAALGAVAFVHADGIAFLEDLLHPRIAERRMCWMRDQAARCPAPRVVVCEVPLLFEAGLHDLFDAVVVVTAPEDIRRARVEARGQSFDARRGRQWDERDKVAAADISYSNDSGPEALDAFVARVMHRYADGRGTA